MGRHENSAAKLIELITEAELRREKKRRENQTLLAGQVRYRDE